MVYAATVLTVGLLAVPLMVLVSRSFNGDFYRALLVTDPVVGTPAVAVRNSLLFATVAMGLAMIVGLMAAAIITRRKGQLSRWFDMALMLPLGTSAVTIGFGFIVALDWPFDLRATLWLIPIAHALVAVPFVVRSTVPTLRAIPEDLRGAASTLGARPWQVWRHVDLPIVSRAALVGAAFAFVISLGEFGATSFIARPTTPTIPTMIFRLLSRPGETSFGTAMALSVVLAAMTAGIVMWIDRAQAGDIGRF
jgi:thiamine transport system permease protein